MFKVPIDLVRALSIFQFSPIRLIDGPIKNIPHLIYPPDRLSSIFPLKKETNLLFVLTDCGPHSQRARSARPRRREYDYISRWHWIPWMFKLYYLMKRPLAIPSYLLQILLILQMECFGMCCSVSMIIAWQRKVWPR